MSSHALQLQSLAQGNIPQFPVQRGQRDLPASSDLQVSGAVNRKPVAFGKMESPAPGLSVGFSVHFHGEQRETRQSAIAKISGVASAPDIQLQNIRNLSPREGESYQAPSSGTPSAPAAARRSSSRVASGRLRRSANSR